MIGATKLINFTAVMDMTAQLSLAFADTRGNRATGAVSYELAITNIGDELLRGPLTILLDPGRYFGDSIVDASQGSGDQSDLWIMDISDELVALGGTFDPGESIPFQTITVVPASLFGNAALVKFNLGHGVYAVLLIYTGPKNPGRSTGEIHGRGGKDLRIHRGGHRQCG